MRYLLWTFLIVQSLSYATIVTIDDVETMSQKSDVIFQGRVISQEVKEEASGRIITLTKVEVIDAIKGDSPKGCHASEGWQLGHKTLDPSIRWDDNCVAIYQVGGSLNGRVLRVEGAQTYRVGEEIILFALPLRNTVVSYGLGLGKFRVTGQGQVVEDIHGVMAVKDRDLMHMRLETPQPRTFGSVEEFKKLIVKSMGRKGIFKQKTIKKRNPAKPVFFDQTEPGQYRFLCNGMDADGNLPDDQCGPCTDQTATRWSGARLDMRVDTGTLPSGLSKADWTTVVDKSMNAWSVVPGTSLRIARIGDVAKRTFGGDLANHELFWIVDSTDWRNQVGSGEHSTLGVTLAPYACQEATSSRTLYDADLALNGTGDFDWSPDCESFGNCLSIQSTLTHELGHAVGLGHPCTVCSWSIMSAQAGYNVQYPLFQDQQGVRALYATGETGLTGMSCRTTSCQSGLSCISQERDQYCTLPCNAQSQCPNAYVCNTSSSSPMCEFESGALSGAAQLGQSCQAQPCLDGLICAGGDAIHVYCYASCTKTTPCATGESCAPLEGSMQERGVCLHFSKLGESCDYQRPCESKLICLSGVCSAASSSDSSGPIKSGGCACVKSSKHAAGFYWAAMLLVLLALRRQR